ncbi:MAG: PSD1 and planctomycete cytochrome C domain-containing protein [Bryobacteraceae bacterium]
MLRPTILLVLSFTAVPCLAQQDFFEGTVKPILQANCWSCHSERNKTSGLALDSREAALAGGKRGAGQLLEAVSHTGSLRMPPTGKLKPEQIAALEKWVGMGMPWSDAGHWSFRPPVKPSPPEVQNSKWVRNPIDSFILSRLEKEGLSPSPDAEKITLLRRVSLDLIGIPPSPEEIREFLADTRPDAYERVVDRLLASPHYGERWGRHWLDLARYADSNGYNIDGPREIWKYRDWVIQALNRDLPFDRFVIEQLAGDLLPNPTTDQLIATGFHRNTALNLEGGIDFEQYRVEAVVDRVDTTGSAFLGLTLGCARCHDHKYDPISQREFYQIYSFFNNVDEMTNGRDREYAHQPVLEMPTPEQAKRRSAFRTQIELLEDELNEYERAQGLVEKRRQWERTLPIEERQKFVPETQVLFDMPPEERTETQNLLLARLYAEANKEPALEQRVELIEAMRKREPEVTSTLVMKELAEPRQAYVQLGGDFLRKGDPVAPGVPEVLPPLEADGRPTRLDFAEWIVSPENPLTARVTVNRLWQRYFGKGIVATENDFGTQGTPPTHPALLDWLATEFVDRKWSLKAMHRLIVTSSTYRQSSLRREDLAKADPENHLLGKQNRLRLDAEIVRDSALAASGLLTTKIGGPSVYPPIPEGALGVTQIKREWPTSQGPDRYRRGMYTFFWRSAPYPGLIVFDAPDATAACTRRNRSNTPLQALTLLNNEAFVEAAQALAQRILKEDPEERLNYAYRLALARQPAPEERKRLEEFLAAQDAEPALAAWTSVSRALFNLDEFVTRE